MRYDGITWLYRSEDSWDRARQGSAHDREVDPFYREGVNIAADAANIATPVMIVPFIVRALLDAGWRPR